MFWIGFCPYKILYLSVYRSICVATARARVYALSQYECGNSILPQLIPNCLCQWFLMSNIMLHLMLLQGNFLWVKPLVTVPRICWQEQSVTQRLVKGLHAVGGYGKRAMSCCFFKQGATFMMQFPLAFFFPSFVFLFWPKPSNRIRTGKNRRGTPEVHLALSY